eukprot:2714129-Ditylum_brightwellii.AAC.1
MRTHGINKQKCIEEVEKRHHGWCYRKNITCGLTEHLRSTYRGKLDMTTARNTQAEAKWGAETEQSSTIISCAL